MFQKYKKILTKSVQVTFPMELLYEQFQSFSQFLAHFLQNKTIASEKSD